MNTVRFLAVALLSFGVASVHADYVIGKEETAQLMPNTIQENVIQEQAIVEVVLPKTQWKNYATIVAVAATVYALAKTGSIKRIWQAATLKNVLKASMAVGFATIAYTFFKGTSSQEKNIVPVVEAVDLQKKSITESHVFPIR